MDTNVLTDLKFQDIKVKTRITAKAK